MNPLLKVFSIIETVVSRQNRGATYSEVTAELGLPKSSVHRILKDLVDLGYLTFNRETKCYFGSLRLAALGAEVMAHFQLRAHIRPYLIELHAETEHTTNFGIRNGSVGVFLDKVESKDFGIKLFSEIGKNFPLYCTGLGKTLLAFGEPDLRRAIDRFTLEPITERTIIDPDSLLEELKKIKASGYAVDDEEITRGIVCVAAPVFGIGKELVGAISIAFPAYIKNERGITGEIDAVRKYSELISQALGSKRIEKAALENMVGRE